MSKNNFKKILILNEQHHSNIGGTERYVRNLINIFTESDNFYVYEISMFFDENLLKYINNYEYVKQDFFKNLNITNLKKITNKNLFGKLYLWFKLIVPLLKWSAFINKFIKKNSIDYVIDNTVNIPNGLMFISKRTKCVWIQHFDASNYIEKNIFTKVFRKILSFIFCVKNRFKIENVVVYSDNDKKSFIDKKLISKHANFFSIPLSCSSKEEIKYRLDNIDEKIRHKSQIAYIGRLNESQKNISFLKKIVDSSERERERERWKNKNKCLW